MFVLLCQHSSEVAGELGDSVKEYEQALYGATDRMGFYGDHDFLTEEASLVGLLALRGKIELMMKHLSSCGAELDKSLELHFNSLIQSWGDYVEDYRTATTSKLSEHYKTFILRFYQGSWDSGDSESYLNDLDWYQDQRDSIECFLIGSDVEWPEADFRGPLVEPDRTLRTFFKTILVPYIHKNFAPSVVTDTNIDWLPERFWWRHL